MQIISFPYISHPGSKLLILGTMPGIQSLEKNQYYGHPRNNFWKIVSSILDHPFPLDYETRKNMLLNNNIALWDVLQACERKGSLDSAIKKEIPNDFPLFLMKHPEIKHIFFNGQKAAAYFKKYVQISPSYKLTTLPSTSPANAGKSYEMKLREWEVLNQVLKTR